MRRCLPSESRCSSAPALHALPQEQVKAESVFVQLSGQETLVAGMLRPAHLLDVVRHFMLFMAADGQTVKSVCRYQQYRAVNRAIHRLRTGKTRRAGRRARPARRHRLAHPGLGQEPDHGVPDAQAAHRRAAAPLQGGGGDRPPRPGAPALRHGHADRPERAARHLGRGPEAPAAPPGAGHRVRHDPEAARRRCGRRARPEGRGPAQVATARGARRRWRC